MYAVECPKCHELVDQLYKIGEDIVCDECAFSLVDDLVDHWGYLEEDLRYQG